MSAAAPLSRRVAAIVSRPLITVVACSSASSDEPEHDPRLGGFDRASSRVSALFWIEGSTVAPTLATRDEGCGDDRERARLLDQYYTQPEIAARYYRVFTKRYDPARFLMVEPSAGAGAFFGLMPNGSLAFDIDPRSGGIWKADFLKVQMRCTRPIAVLGNPPFGRNSSLAIAFFNRAAAQSHVVAFILPRTARKHGFQNRLDRNFHLVHEEIVPKRAFLFCGRPYTVTAVFQIWERRRQERELWPSDTEHPDFDILPDKEGADFAIRRVGGKAGLVLPDLEGSPHSHLFIRAKVPGVKEAMIALEREFVNVAGNIAGNPCLAKSELVDLYNRRHSR